MSKEKSKANLPPFYLINKNSAEQNGLQDKISSFVKTLSTVQPAFNVVLEKVDGQFNYVVEHDEARCFLHSLYDIDREMEEMFRGVGRDIEVLVLFGFGCGYALDYIGEHFPALERVIIIEPCLQLLRTVLKFEKVVKRVGRIKSATFMWNKTSNQIAAELAGEINTNLKKKLGFAYHLAYRTLFKGYFEHIHQLLTAHVVQLQVNIATVDKNLYLKTQNIISNLKVKSIDIEVLLNKLQGIPAIMVSAGPSLNKNIHLLEAAKEKALVVTVGSANKILYNRGTRPHLRAAFSPYPDENMVFHGMDDFEGIPLIFSNTLDYMVVQRYNARKARMVMVSDLMSRYFYRNSGQKHTLVEGGGTIANVTFDLLCRAGCGKIIFTGQDMCLTDNSFYADGSWSDQKFTGQEQGLIKTKDCFGNDVFTTKPLNGLKTSFEAVITRYPAIEFLNATEGGLPIENAPNKSLQEVLDGIEETRDVQGLIQEAFAEGEVEDGDYAVLNEVLLAAEKDLEGILKINENRYLELTALGENGKSISRAVKELESMISKYESELMTIPFYAEVIRYELDNPFAAVKSSFQYSGSDLYKKAESLQRIIIGLTNKLFEYGQFFKEMLASKNHS